MLHSELAAKLRLLVEVADRLPQPIAQIGNEEWAA